MTQRRPRGMIVVGRRRGRHGRHRRPCRAPARAGAQPHSTPLHHHASATWSAASPFGVSTVSSSPLCSVTYAIGARTEFGLHASRPAQPSNERERGEVAVAVVDEADQLPVPAVYGYAGPSCSGAVDAMFAWGGRRIPVQLRRSQSATWEGGDVSHRCWGCRMTTSSARYGIAAWKSGRMPGATPARRRPSGGPAVAAAGFPPRVLRQWLLGRRSRPGSRCVPSVVPLPIQPSHSRNTFSR